MSSGIVARILKLQRPAPDDWIIIGAHRFSRELAKVLIEKANRTIVLLDTNPTNIRLSKRQNLNAIQCDGMDAEELYEEEQLLFGAGYMIALTDNSELNQLLMQRWAQNLSQESVYGWVPNENPNKNNYTIGETIFEKLDPPAAISSELIKGNYSIESIDVKENVILNIFDSIPLLIIRGKIIKKVIPDEPLENQVQIDDSIIIYKKSQMITICS